MSRRRIIATLYNHAKEVLWVRRFAYFDTAMPRAVQLAMTYGQSGDFVEFASTELGFQLGILRVEHNGKFKMEMSPLVAASPALMKLMKEDS